MIRLFHTHVLFRNSFADKAPACLRSEADGTSAESASHTPVRTGIPFLPTRLDPPSGLHPGLPAGDLRYPHSPASGTQPNSVAFGSAIGSLITDGPQPVSPHPTPASSIPAPSAPDSPQQPSGKSYRGISAPLDLPVEPRTRPSQCALNRREGNSEFFSRLRLAQTDEVTEVHLLGG